MTSEWSSVSCSSSPSRTRYARESPTWPIVTSAALDERDGHRRSHPRRRRDRRSRARRRGGSPPGSATSRFSGPDARAGIGLLERRGRELRRDLAGLRAAHAVGDREERRRDDVRVLVPPALLARVARAARTAPTLMPRTSARSRRRGRRRRARACAAGRCGRRSRSVPFVEPRSCTQTPSRRGSMRACRADANSSPSIEHVVLPAAADRERRGVELVLLARARGRALVHDDEPAGG